MSSGESQTTDEVTPAEGGATGPDAEQPQEVSDAEELASEEQGEERLNLEVEITDVGPCRKRIQVQIPQEDIQATFDEQFAELVSNAAVPGFRPGHAPRRLIEKKYRKEAADSVKQKLLVKSLEQIDEDYDITPISEPKIDIASIEIPKEGPLLYDFEVEVSPEFEVPNYKGLRIERPMKEFGEKDVDGQMQRYLRDFGQLVPKTGQVESGDYIIADITFRDGEEIVTKVEELSIRVQPVLRFQDGTVEDFEKSLLGAQINECREVSVRISPEAPNAALRGKTVRAEVLIKDLKRLRLPELDDQFLHEIGYDSEQELRDALHSMLRRRLEYEQRNVARQQLLAQLSESTKIELPPSLVRRQVQSTMRRMIMDMQEAGYTEEEIRRRHVELQQRSISTTQQYLREHFLLVKIAEAEELEVTEEDVAKQIEIIAMQNDESPRRVRARLAKEGNLELLEVKILEQLAVDRALEYAEFVDVPLKEAVETAEEAVETSATPADEIDEEAEEESEKDKQEEARKPAEPESAEGV